MEKLQIGIIVKPQGITGELKMKNLADGFDSINSVKTVYIDDKPKKVLNIRNGNDAVYIMLSQIADRNAAEELRNKAVFCSRDEINKSENEFFIVDVIGCNLYLSSGKLIGKITDINSQQVDLYHIDGDEGQLVFPMLKALEPVFDIENKKVTVNAKRFTEVVLNEN